MVVRDDPSRLFAWVCSDTGAANLFAIGFTAGVQELARGLRDRLQQRFIDTIARPWMQGFYRDQPRLTENFQMLRDCRLSKWQRFRDILAAAFFMP